MEVAELVTDEIAFLRRVRDAAVALVKVDVPPHRWEQRAWELSILRDLLEARDAAEGTRPEGDAI